ncbi:MAG: aminotransferase class IV [Rhodospirillales bacterium]|jgi:branched-chain amino acid aminotransferase|nr:aminotransferase class IV [Rhodospirillales bacterium]
MRTEKKTEPDAGFPPGVAFIDGDFCDISEARISILDFGFLHSDATYDVVHVWRRRFFRLDRHLDRFLDNVAKLQLALPFDRRTVAQTLTECVRRSGLDDAYVEMICTRGTAPGYSRDPRQANNRFIAFAIPFSWVANEEQRSQGLNLFISTVNRIPSRSVDPTIKNYHWLDFIKGTFEAYEHDAETVVLVDEDANITEGPGFNLFAVSGGRVTTPGQGTIKGITRRTTLELCAELGIEAGEGALSADRLGAADEAFITSTAGGIMAVTRIDGTPLGDGKPGPVTARLTDLYWQKHDDPAWTTPVD